MGTINEKVDSRTTQEKRELYNDSRRNRKVRSESRSNGSQQERTDRTDSPRSNFIGDGSAVTGGILRQLIEESKSQVAAKKTEILQLESKIQDFNALLEKLEANKET